MPAICTFFLQGYCARANSCKYAHILNPEVMGDHIQLENSNRLPYFAEMQSNANIRQNSLKTIRDVSKPRMLECKTALINVIAHHFTNADVLDFEGHLLLLCKDQQGCRFLQRKLDERKYGDADLLFREVSSSFPDLMIDPFGNYLCQKMLDHSNDLQKSEILKLVVPHLISICKNTHGTRAAQKLCEVAACSDLVFAFLTLDRSNNLYLESRSNWTDHGK
jgi:hypothetical protein